MKMLVCVSSKEHANDVVTYAARLAKASASQVIILHVQPRPWSRSRGYVEETQKKRFSECLNALPEHLEQFVEEPCRILEEAGVHVRAVMAEGDDAAKAILRTADEEDVDLIVCGATIHRMVEQIFQPSITARLLRMSSRPVLVVPHPRKKKS